MSEVSGGAGDEDRVFALGSAHGREVQEADAAPYDRTERVSRSLQQQKSVTLVSCNNGTSVFRLDYE